MSTRQYRALLIASIIVGLVGGGIDLVFPQLVPEAFHQAQTAHDNAFSTVSLFLFVGFGVFGVALLFASSYGLYRFRPWAPRLSLISTVLCLLCWSFSGAFAQSGVAIAISYFSSYLWGAVIILAYVQPLNTLFSRREG